MLSYKSYLLFASFIMTVNACGRTEQKVDLKNDLLGDVSDPNCKKGACAEVQYSLVDGAGLALDGSSAKGQVGLPVEWIIKVKSSAPAARIKIAVTEAAQWMQKKNSAGDAGSISIVGTPTEVVSMSSVVILARDMSRCSAMESVAKDCLSPEKSFDKYDKKFKLNYSVTSDGKPNVVPVTPTPKPKPDDNCNKNGGILQTIGGMIPFIGGFISGGNSSGCK